jgi:hypothetical protein
MCGKTNIAQALARHTGIHYFKNNIERDAFTDDPLYFSSASRYIDTYMTSFLAATGVSVIFDRNFPSEYVYPVVFGRTRDLNVLRRIDEAHAQIGTLIIIPYRSSFDGISDDIHSNITATVLKQIDELYMEFCTWTKCQTLRLCVDDGDIERELADVMRFIDCCMCSSEVNSD